MNSKKYIVSPENPQGILVDLTSEEIAQREQKVIKRKQEKITFEAEQEAKEIAKASALAKLSALGLTQEEILSILK
jgi:hypothetical protein